MLVYTCFWVLFSKGMFLKKNIQTRKLTSKKSITTIITTVFISERVTSIYIKIDIQILTFLTFWQFWWNLHDWHGATHTESIDRHAICAVHFAFCYSYVVAVVPAIQRDEGITTVQTRLSCFCSRTCIYTSFLSRFTWFLFLFVSIISVVKLCM